LKYLKYLLIPLLIIIADQTLKLWVHQNMVLGEERIVFDDWFRLLYVLNPGFAYGMKIDATYGKLVLTLFRLLATGGITWYLIRLIRKDSHPGFIICLAMVLGGAAGNLIDSMFYGIWLDNAPVGSPMALFHGQVIDMFYFPIWTGFLPDWVPLKGGDYFIFFRPVFNIADSFVFIGFAVLLLFQKRFLPSDEKTEPGKEEEAASSTEN
jgi:signal peptidase II